MGAKGNIYKVSVGKPNGKTPLGRPTRRWNYNIKMDVKILDGAVGTGLIWL
jgi:hypothetical protein